MLVTGVVVCTVKFVIKDSSALVVVTEFVVAAELTGNVVKLVLIAPLGDALGVIMPLAVLGVVLLLAIIEVVILPEGLAAGVLPDVDVDVPYGDVVANELLGALDVAVLLDATDVVDKVAT